MNEKLKDYSEKFLTITPREQYLVLGTGVVVLFLFFYSFFIADNIDAIEKQNKSIARISAENKSTQHSIELLESALVKDPNKLVENQIEQHQKKLTDIDKSLIDLTSDLISPIQMRHALTQLLQMQKGVKLISFETLPATPLMSINDKEVSAQQGEKVKVKLETLTAEEKEMNELLAVYAQEHQDFGLYQHQVKIKLEGSYFQLRDYLLQLEALPWTFFWKSFDYQLTEYPKSELEIEIYSLSTHSKYIGV